MRRCKVCTSRRARAGDRRMREKALFYGLFRFGAWIAIDGGEGVSGAFLYARTAA